MNREEFKSKFRDAVERMKEAETKRDKVEMETQTNTTERIEMKLFRNLTTKEEEEFRRWARDNYEPFSEIKGVWHPIVQDECVKINQEKGQ